MGIRETVYSRITSASAGSLVGTRCYPASLPENVTLPAMRYRVVSYNDYSYREYGNSTERAQQRIQFDCYAKTSDAVAELAEAVKTDWDGWTNGTAVGWCRVANHFQDGWNDDVKAYREIIDVMVDHKRG